MKKIDKYTIIIPSLNPDDKLIKLVEDLMSKGLNNIIVVNDGSSKEYDDIFNKLPSSIKIIKHETNLGKGASLKDAIKTIENSEAFITVDADGQHKVEDVIKIKGALKYNDIVLGVRNFNLKQVPLRSKFGNKFSSLIFKIRTGITLKDTQTGLRGISIKYKELALNTNGNRYEYEMNFLYSLVKNNIKIKTIPIKTIYEEDNESHFNVIRDSMLIHKWLILVLLVFILLIVLIMKL